jgi:altronate dehydratase small subunit
MRHALLIKDDDNVANVLDDIQSGEEFCFTRGGSVHILKAADAIKFGFKVSVKRIAKNEKIMKYGYAIGVASTEIQPGECVHIHNVEGSRGRGDKKEMQ